MKDSIKASIKASNQFEIVKDKKGQFHWIKTTRKGGK